MVSRFQLVSLWWTVDFKNQTLLLLLMTAAFKFQKMLQTLLNRNGAVSVDLAEKGLEAVQAALAEPQKYKIIFMENFMPIMVHIQNFFLFLLNVLWINESIYCLL